MLDDREVLFRYLQQAREALLWKLEGLSEYDIRRPLVPTGTNLLGLVKHVASVEAGYLGDIFGRPSPESLPWFDEGAEDNADMWATVDQSRESIVELYRRVWVHSDETIGSLDLDTPGVVPWWSEEKKHVTLRTILVHMIAETNRHAGHADIVRELIDGAVGHRADNSNLPELDAVGWGAHRERLEQTALSFLTDGPQYRASFDAVVTFSNGGQLSAEGFRVDVPSADTNDDEIARLFVASLNLLMVSEVRLSNVHVFEEPHRGTAGGPSAS